MCAPILGLNSTSGRCYRLTAVCLLMLCVCLLTAIIVLWIQFIKERNLSKNLQQEKDELGNMLHALGEKIWKDVK